MLLDVARQKYVADIRYHPKSSWKRKNEFQGYVIWSWIYMRSMIIYSIYSSQEILTLNSSPPSAAYMRQRTESAVVQVIACRLFIAKPLPETMLAYCQLDTWKQISVKFESEFYHFHSRKCIWNSRLPKWRPCCQGRLVTGVGSRMRPCRHTTRAPSWI